MDQQLGGCLCGNVRYGVSEQPGNVAICFCRMCQVLTGSDYMVEPVFAQEHLTVISGSPASYQHRSEGSGLQVTVHFCSHCGTTLFHHFERFPGAVGVFAGTFDEPGWCARDLTNVDYIYLHRAPRGALVPAGYRTHLHHFLYPDGSVREPTVLSDHLLVQ